MDRAVQLASAEKLLKRGLNGADAQSLLDSAFVADIGSELQSPFIV
jgi:hypothetical protein